MPGNVGWPSPIVTYTVPNPRPMVRGESDTGAVVMEGDATGLNNLAGLGLLNTDSAVYYAGTLANRPGAAARAWPRRAPSSCSPTPTASRPSAGTRSRPTPATPRRRARTRPRRDLSDSPIELFPGTTITSKSYATYVGAVNVTASSYGNSVSYTPEDQAYSAIDNNFDTAWITGTFVPDPEGQWWQVAVRQPGHHRPHHPGPAAARRPLALGVGGHPHLRRQGPRHLRRSTPRPTSRPARR